MENLFKKLLQLSKSNVPIQHKLQKKQFVDQMKAIIDQKKKDTKTNIHSGVSSARLWMEEFTGLDKVHAAQSDVFHFQAEFIRSQAKRRELGTQLASLQSELNELHNDIVTTDRRDERYLQLITREHKLLKMENQLRNDFVLTEAEERENFTLFTTKIKESQDKEREQALRTKYWTIIVSSAVTVIGVLGNGLISFLKMHKMDKTILSLGEETKALNQSIHSNINQLDISQAQVVALLNHIATYVRSESYRNPADGTAKNHIDASLIELLRQTNRKLDALSKLDASSQVSTGDSAFHRIDASQTEMMRSLKLILGHVEAMKNLVNDNRKVQLKSDSKSMISEDSGSKESSVGKAYSSVTNYSSGLGSKIANIGSGIIESSGLGSKIANIGSGIIESSGFGSKKTGSDSKTVEQGYSDEGGLVDGTDDVPWTRKVVYFGLVTCVLVLLGRVLG